MGVVDPTVALFDHDYHLLAHRHGNGILWDTAAIPMGKSSGAFLSIRRKKSPSMAFTYPKNLCRFSHRPALL
jgi:hypothetical protein